MLLLKPRTEGESRSWGSQGGGCGHGGQGPMGSRLGWGQGPFLTAVHIRRLIPRLHPAVHRCLSGAALIPPLRIYVNLFPSRTSVAFIVSKLVVCKQQHSRASESLLLQSVPRIGQTPTSQLTNWELETVAQCGHPGSFPHVFT